MEEEKEIKEEEIEAEITPQPKEEEEKEVEDIESLPAWAQERLKKEQEEKENYKKGMLSAKRRSLSPEKEVEEKGEEDYPDWDETSKKFQEQTMLKAEKIAEKKAQQILDSQNEKTAIDSFISNHPEFKDDSKWNQLVSNYHAKSGKESPSKILRDLERAYYITKLDNGDITELELEAFKKGKAKGMIESKIADLSAVKKEGSRESGKEALNEQQKIAQRLATDLPPGFSLSK